MIKNDRLLTLADMAKILAAELVFFPQISLSDFLVRAWFSHFEGHAYLDVANAFHQAVQEAHKGFPPTPGDVMRELEAIYHNKMIATKYIPIAKESLPIDEETPEIKQKCLSLIRNCISALEKKGAKVL